MTAINLFRCFLCSETFQTVTALSNHSNLHNILKPFQCGFCTYSFHENEQLLSHISTVHGELPMLYTCNICNVLFREISALEKHVALCQNVMVSCSDRVGRLDSVKEELIEEESNILQVQSCLFGGRKVKSSWDLMGVHSDTHCDNATINDGNIKRTKKNKRKESVKDKQGTHYGSALDSDDDQMVSFQENDIDSINTVKTTGRTDLEIGTYLSGSTVQPKDGTGTKMSSSNTITKEDCYSVLCVKCNSHFEDASLMESHLDQKICPGFKCPECSKSFGLEFQLIKHDILVHKRNAEKQCSKCGKKCTTIRAWTRHEARHAESDPFLCKICGRYFKNLEYLMRYHLPKSHNIQHTLPSVHKPTSQTICVAGENSGSGEEGSSFGPQAKQSVRQKPVKVEHQGDGKEKRSDENKKTKGDKKAQREEEKVEVCVDCDLCGGKVPSQDMLATHRRFHFMDDKYSVKCSGCSDSFNSKTDLIYHIQEKYCSLYNCQECQQIFPTELDYVNHKSQVHATLSECGQYKCPDCQQEFTDHSSYVQHAEDHTTSRPFQCKICDETFVSISTMETHLSLIHTLIKEKEAENIGYTCVRCLTHFRNKDTNMTHSHFHSMKRKIGHGMGDDCDISTVSTPYYCRICHVGFANLLDLERHKQQHEITKWPKCSFCGKLFLQNSSLQNHLDSHKKSYLCATCGEKFSKNKSLEEHVLAVHSGENPFKCHICSRAFKGHASLRLHVLKHEKPGLYNFKCKICSKMFPEFSKLQSHLITVHTEEKRFECKICGRRFRHKGVLNKHIDRHNGFKAYKCRYCDKRFYGSHPRNTHEMTHTGEKNFVCSVCGSKFITKSYLRTHMRIHTKEKPYSCPGCSHSFAMLSNLTGHVRKVHKDNPEIFRRLEDQKRFRAMLRDADKKSERQYVSLKLAHCTNEIETSLPN